MVFTLSQIPFAPEDVSVSVVSGSRLEVSKHHEMAFVTLSAHHWPLAGLCGRLSKFTVPFQSSGCYDADIAITVAFDSYGGKAYTAGVKYRTRFIACMSPFLPNSKKHLLHVQVSAT